MEIRQWRVGSVSMGVAMLMGGLMIALNTWQGNGAADRIFVWWPLIMILLGLETLVYLFRSREPHPVIRFDALSVLFIGMIGTICIGLTFLSSLGIVQEVRSAVHAVDVTRPFPQAEASVPADIARIVVDNPGVPVRLVDGDEGAVRVFGSYRGLYDTDRTLLGDWEKHAVQIRPDGHALFVQLLAPPAKRGMFSEYPRVDVTLVAPKGVQVEIHGPAAGSGG